MNPAAPSRFAMAALSEYTRRKERAVLDVANQRIDRARAERTLAAWLAVALLAGADHRDVTAALEPYAAPVPGAESWTDLQCRAAAASWLAPNRSWAAHLAHAVTQARTRAEADFTTPAHPDERLSEVEGASRTARNAASLAHYRALRDLAAWLGAPAHFEPALEKAAA